MLQSWRSLLDFRTALPGTNLNVHNEALQEALQRLHAHTLTAIAPLGAASMCIASAHKHTVFPVRRLNFGCAAGWECWWR